MFYLTVLIWDNSKLKSGLMAQINSAWIKYFIRAIWTNRTFLLTGTLTWALDIEYCQNKNDTGSYLCYFLPISICHIDDVMNRFNDGKGNLPDYHGKTKPPNCTLYWYSPCEYRIIYIDGAGGSWRPLKEDIQQWTMEKYFADYHTWRAVMFSFFLRLQSNMKQIAFNKVYKSIHESLIITDSNNISDINTNILKFDPFETIGLPVRASDKCNKHEKLEKRGFDIVGEMECFKPKEYFNILLAMKDLEPSLHNVILTSEDSEYINNITRLIDEYNHDIDEKSVQINKKWNLILNTGDNRPEMGHYSWVKDLETNIDKKNDYKKNIESNVIIGALTSIYLQTFSKYLFTARSSSFVNSIWLMAYHLNCEKFWFDDLLTINIFNGIHDNDNYNNSKKKLINFNFNRQCLETRSAGANSHKIKKGEKIIYFPHSLHEKYHILHWTKESFKEKYNITVDMSRFCTNEPVQSSQRVG